ncbi:hypothetical protein Ddye_026803 [Dipteronia dyeriana]|uniref:Uncharacterized protein n=1 Tax=Dipteronia dyeriana TaxID=168575 RepID=A0AAD9TNP1_9ROSI|nr:hypothetical protein Ddye_026803 [Dipteronia dyeriana]
MSTCCINVKIRNGRELWKLSSVYLFQGFMGKFMDAVPSYIKWELHVPVSVVTIDGILLTKSGTMTGGMEARSKHWDDKIMEAEISRKLHYWTPKEDTVEKFKDTIVDRLYDDFSQSVGVANIGEYEENQLKDVQHVAEERLNLSKQLAKLKYHCNLACYCWLPVLKAFMSTLITRGSYGDPITMTLVGRYTLAKLYDLPWTKFEKMNSLSFSISTMA